ncbi:MAG: thymidine phosphorylase family protein [Xanthobacteraceae bacterium]|nr:MAG: thymidine phosphorylase family protein [Xanthobacteraceae bacterium]
MTQHSGNGNDFGGRNIHVMRARRLGIDTQHEAFIFMRKDCHVCRAEGFAAHARVEVRHGADVIDATLYQVTSDLLHHNEVGFSEAAWRRLALTDGDEVTVSHPPIVESLSIMRGKVYGRRFDDASLQAIMTDVVAGRYSDIHLAAFVTACSARELDLDETVALTRAMVGVGETMTWPSAKVLDKHCIGGLPGNRTTPIVVAIAAACGLTIPKTSSRAITSPAGTADTMETMAPVMLDRDAIRRVVEREGGCVVWGGAVRLSPADDILIRVERALDLDSGGQLAASVLSKKIAAGSSHVVLDLPVGPTAKVRTRMAAKVLARNLIAVAETFGLVARIVYTDGTQPVGRGIGPALEARDVLAVLQNSAAAPADLRDRAIALAGEVLELGGIAGGAGRAAEVLRDGRAWRKFQRICEAQGGMRTPPVSQHRRDIHARHGGTVRGIDNRRIARVAKLAGAPEDKAAGIELHVRLGTRVERGQPLYTIHAEAAGELDYSLAYAAANPDILVIED